MPVCLCVCVPACLLVGASVGARHPRPDSPPHPQAPRHPAPRVRCVGRPLGTVDSRAEQSRGALRGALRGAPVPSSASTIRMREPLCVSCTSCVVAIRYTEGPSTGSICFSRPGSCLLCLSPTPVPDCCLAAGGAIIALRGTEAHAMLSSHCIACHLLSQQPIALTPCFYYSESASRLPSESALPSQCEVHTHRSCPPCLLQAFSRGC